MRARNIKPRFFKNEILAELAFATRLLFVGLWLLADREGLVEDRPKRIAAEVFPFDRDVDVEADLIDLQRTGFIARFQVGGLGLIEVLNFKKHQSPHHTERRSTFPARVHGDPTVNLGLPNGENPPDSLIHRFSDSPIQNPLSEQERSDEDESPSLRKLRKESSKEACRLAALLRSEIQRNKPDFRVTPTQERNWSATAQWMIDLDKRDPCEIEQLIRWVQRDDFWMTNILSMDKLRKQFDQLQLKRGRHAGKSQHVGFEQRDYTAGLKTNEDGTYRL